MSFSSTYNKREKQAIREAEFRAESIAREAEAERKANLCLDTAIEEADASDDVKLILKRIARAAGLPLFEDGVGSP